MIFNSIEFIIFISLIVPLFYITPHKFRWIVLLLGGYYFYMAWNPFLMILLLFSVFVNYSISLRINKLAKPENRKKWLILAMLINFGLLFFFKYTPLLNETTAYFYSLFGATYVPPEFSIILPMGISFYTFQAASYTIDVYRKDLKPEKNFFKFSLFITFFPQLVAGPIERADALMPQLFANKRFKLDNIIWGLKYIIIGFFKKVVIADRVAIAVNTVYNSPQEFEGLAFIIATVLFAFQIYCDFSGYSDIAIGCAKLFDINLIENFKQPYFSKSIKEFWRRWHISLSTWFKDYVYFPLGGSRGVTKSRMYFNTFITFLVSGMWHGASWTFIIWGALHGFYQIIGDITKKPKEKVLEFLHIKNFFLTNFVRVIITFSLVCFSYIFFRANSVQDSFYIISNLFTGHEYWTSLPYVYETLESLGLGLFELFASVACIAILLIMEMFCKENTIHSVLMKIPSVFRFTFYLFISCLIIALGVFQNAGEFIYFQF